MFIMIVETSSTTLSTAENSCKTPSISMYLTAAPGNEDRIRRKEFPSVVP